MFVQVISGRVGDKALLDRQAEVWKAELKPGATGYLGSTAGVTADGRGIVIVRFESAEAAQANAERSEQSGWWAETVKAFEGDVEFQNCHDVDVLRGGGSDDAGFVQVMRGRAKDQDEMRRTMSELEPELVAMRPDVVGALCAWHGDGGFTQAIYFTSEAAARAGESATEDAEAGARLMDLIDGEIEFLDLTEPQLD